MGSAWWAEFAWVLVVGFLPVAEIRGAVPLAYYFFRGNPASLYLGLAAGLAGNLAVAPAALFLLSLAERWVLGDGGVPKWLATAYRKLVSYARKKARGHEKWGVVGLAVFVAIPLPGTGAWTGALVAHVLGIDKKSALLGIELGVVGAFAIVLAAVSLGLEALKALFGIA